MLWRGVLWPQNYFLFKFCVFVADRKRTFTWQPNVSLILRVDLTHPSGRAHGEHLEKGRPNSDGDWTSLLFITFKRAYQIGYCQFNPVATAHGFPIGARGDMLRLPGSCYCTALASSTSSSSSSSGAFMGQLAAVTSCFFSSLLQSIGDGIQCHFTDRQITDITKLKSEQNILRDPSFICCNYIRKWLLLCCLS